jgi:BirA family biotin operon repressor/biotin-[acetyl-CoA-carboxylase] ligase
MVAVAVAEALAEVSGLSIHLKWPNDIEIGGKKVSGILTEAVIQPGAAPAVIVGIGVNVNNAWEHFPPELRERATSLALAAGQRFSRSQLIARLLAQLEHFYLAWQQTGIAPILERWLYYGPIVGRSVRLSTDESNGIGTVMGLDADGALLVDTGSHTAQRIYSGEIIYL